MLVRIQKEHGLSLLIRQWDNLIFDFFDDYEAASLNSKPLPDVEKMLAERRRLEKEILKLSN